MTTSLDPSVFEQLESVLRREGAWCEGRLGEDGATGRSVRNQSQSPFDEEGMLFKSQRVDAAFRGDRYRQARLEGMVRRIGHAQACRRR